MRSGTTIFELNLGTTPICGFPTVTVSHYKTTTDTIAIRDSHDYNHESDDGNEPYCAYNVHTTTGESAITS